MLDPEDRGDCGWGPGGGTFGPAEALLCAQNLARTCAFAVLPVREDKAPACPRGFHAASKDPGAIAELWQKWPASLVGIATGGTSDLAALDVDLKHPEAVRWWRANEKLLPQTRAYRTRSGGLHVFFRHAPGVRCSTGRPVLGVDVRGERGYIIAWYAAGFECLDHATRAPWPAWLTREIWPPAPPRPPEQHRPAVANEGAVAAVVAKVSGAREGNRNGLLYWGARRLAEKGMAAREIETTLVPAALSAGLAELEARRTLSSAAGR
jgi:hypothetical protein